jgi:molybdopterin-binding protein
MPRKQQGWVTFQTSDEERQILEQYCQESQRSKTEILRELVRNLKASEPPTASAELNQTVERIPQNSEPKTVKVSARNILHGTVKQLIKGAVTTEVILEIAPKVELVSVITTASAEELALHEGKQVYAVIKSSNVMLAIET